MEVNINMDMHQKRKMRKEKSVNNTENKNESMNINWFPGHMTKTRRRMEKDLPLIDLVAELIDARIPFSSSNPDLPDIIGSKPRLILLNKCDMADDDVTHQWIEHFKKNGINTLCIDSKTGKGFNKIIPTVREILADRIKQLEEKGMSGRTLRVMAVGVPNVGKSSFINRLAGSNRAKVANRPGVTRGAQWFMIAKGVELMDTPGVLWPKFEDKLVGEKLAFTGAVKDTVVDIELLAMRLLETLCKNEKYKDMLIARYKLNYEDLEGDSYDLLCAIGKKRGMKASGGDVNTERCANMLLEEFRNIKIGRISLETPSDVWEEK